MDNSVLDSIRITSFIYLLFQILIGVAIVLLCYYIFLKIRKELRESNKLKRDS